MKIKDLAIGDVFSVEVAPGVVSVGVIQACARASASLMLVSLSDPIAMTADEMRGVAENLPPLCHLKIVGDIKVKNGEWPRLGRTAPGRSENDPLPPFGVELAVVGVRNVLTYSTSMELSDVRPRARDDQRDLPDGSVHSPGSLLAFLRKRLAQGGLGTPTPIGKAVSIGESIDDLDLLHDDESMDFLEGVFGVSKTPWEVLKQTLSDAEQVPYLDTGLGFQSIAAAMVVVALLERQPLVVNVSDAVHRAIAGIPIDLASALVPFARRALQKVMTASSELMTVWHSDADKDRFTQQVQKLSERLGSAARQHLHG